MIGVIRGGGAEQRSVARDFVEHVLQVEGASSGTSTLRLPAFTPPKTPRFKGRGMVLGGGLSTNIRVPTRAGTDGAQALGALRKSRLYGSR